MKVLVTGAAGRLGSECCRALLQAGHEVTATDRSFRRDLPVKIHVANILDPIACYKLLEGMDGVVHLANHPDAWRTSAQTVFGENMTINCNVFQAAHELGVPKILFASSIQTIANDRVRGRPGTEHSRLAYLPIDGHTPAHPANPYALSKVMAEEMLNYYVRRGLREAVAIRFPLLINPEWLQRISRRPRVDYDMLDEVFTFLSFADAARLVAATISATLAGFRIYQPGARSNMAGRSPADLVAEYYADVPLKCPRERLTSLVDTSEITAETGWTPQDEIPISPAEPLATPHARPVAIAN